MAEKFKTYDLKILVNGQNFQLQINAEGLPEREVSDPPIKFIKPDDVIRPKVISENIRGALETELRFDGAVQADDIVAMDTIDIVKYGKELYQKLLPQRERWKLENYIQINAAGDDQGNNKFGTHLRINDDALIKKGIKSLGKVSSPRAPALNL